MKSTKFLAALLAVMMIFGTFAASAAGFTDITLESDPEAYMNALLLNQMGVIKGDENGNANLDADVTRAEMAAFIFRLGTSYTDIVGGVNSTTFQDLDPNGWYISNVVWCYEQGIIAGRDSASTIFDPTANVSYDEAIKMVVTLLGYKGLSYPLGYYLKFLDILKNADTTLAKVLPEYKGDVAGVRNPISRGEVISMLNVAFEAPLADEKGKATTDSLKTTVWADSDNAITSDNAIVVATASKKLPAASAKAASGKIVIAPYDSKKVVDYSKAKEVAAADYGLAADVEIGSFFTYYSMKSGIVKELTTVTASAVIEDAAVSETVKKVDDVDTKFVTINGKEMKSADADAIDYVATYAAANAVPEFAAPASAVAADSFWKAIDAGQDLYVVAYDLFADGSIDFFDWTVKEIGVYGDKAKTTADNDSTMLYTLKTGVVSALNTIKLSTITSASYSDSAKVLNTKIANNASAVKGDIIAVYNIGGKVIVDEILTTFKGTVTKVVNNTTYTVKKADGTKVDLTVATGTAPIANIAVSTSAINVALTATTETNFIVYGSKIVAVYANEDAPEAPKTYAGNSVAIYYGLAARDITFTAKYEYNAGLGAYVLKYEPSYAYYAYVAYEADPATIVKVPVYDINTVQNFTSYYPATYTGAATTAKEAATSQIAGLAHDGTAMVTVTKSAETDATKPTYNKYAISSALSAKELSATTTEVFVSTGKYIAQNALTGYYEIYNAEGKVIRTFRCDDASVILSLTATTDSNKKIDTESNKEIAYRASKLSTFGAITEKTAYEIKGAVILEVAKENAAAKTTYLRKAIVVKNTSGASVGQLIAKTVDTSKDPYDYMILKSIDSIEIDGLKGYATFTVYSPVTGTTQALVLETSAKDDKAENALSTLTAAIDAQLVPNVGKVISYNSTDKVWTGTTLESKKVALTTESANDGKNITLKGNSFTAKATVLDDNGSVYYISAVIDGVTRYFKLSESANIFKMEADDAQKLYAGKKFTKTAVEFADGDNKGKYALADTEITFFVNGASEVVFGYIA